MYQSKRRAWRLLFSIASIIGAAAGWSTLLWPPVQAYYNRPGVGFWDTLVKLASPTNSIYPDGIFVGWLFIASTILLSFAVPLSLLQALSKLIRYIEQSEADVTLLDIKLTARFDDRMERCTLFREQRFHANRHGTTAYHYNQEAHSVNATIDSNTFVMNSSINNERITNDFIIRASARSFEAIEVFDRPLPKSFLATYLPDWLVLILYDHSTILDKVVVERVGEIEISNEHNGTSPIIQLNSLKRVAKNVTIVVDFPGHLAPHPADVKCFVIRENVVSSIHPRCSPAGERRLFTAYISALDHASLRFQWDNKRLHSSLVDQGKEIPEDIEPLNRESGLWSRLKRWYSTI